jgi:ATP-dependent DNA helicase RecQ
MPTGAGKSAIYQVAGALREGVTCVVSPLVALQADQVGALRERGQPAAALNSTITARQRQRALRDLRLHGSGYVFVTPEALEDEALLRSLRRLRPVLLAVDEAHCVSEWGPDFRPEYARLPAAADRLGRPPIVALTASGAPQVRRDVVAGLRLRDPLELVSGFDRRNIWLGVEAFEDPEPRRRRLRELVAGEEHPAIVYVATRREADDLAADIAASAVPAAAFHAGQPKRRRAEVQEAFMRGELPVLVATVAFGMGVDKPDVRTVIHHGMSDSLDSYYHQIGRAGRDGEPARAVLLYRAKDSGLRRFFASAGLVRREELEAIVRALDDAGGTAVTGELAERTDLSESRLGIGLNRLADAGTIDLAHGQVRARDTGRLEVAIGEAVARSAEHREAERGRVDMMRRYAELRDCRRRFLLGYFGERLRRRCGNCDMCDAGRSRGTKPRRGHRLEAGQHVIHREWGRGEVLAIDGDRATVVFESVGHKELLAASALRRGLLRPS